MSAFLWGKSSNKRKAKEAGVGNGMTAGLLSRIRDFKDDTAGDIAVMFGLLAFVMFMFVGAAVDMGRWLHARKQMLDAIDVAVLAGGRELQTSGSDTAAIAAAEKFFNESIEGRLQDVSMAVNFQVNEVDGGLTMGVEGGSFATIATPFMSLGGVPKLPLLNTAGAEWSQAKLATEGNAQQNFEIAMMLDVSGSMNDSSGSGSSTKVADMKLAAQDLINIVVWADQSEFTSKVALLPFSADIRLPTSVFDMVTDPAQRALSSKQVCTSRKSDGTCNSGGLTTYYGSPCVVERTGTEKFSDAAPASGRYITRRFSRASGDRCTIKASSTVVPLTNDKATLLTKVQNLETGGATAGHLGTAWASYALSPNWNSMWPSSLSHVASYSDTGTKKIAILMTDGMYNSEYDSEGIQVNVYYPEILPSTSPKKYKSTRNAAANGSAASQALSLCANMKANGITVYTVGFDLDGITPQSEQDAARNTLATCATDPSKFFDATDGAALRQAFRTIALAISSLYLDK